MDCRITVSELLRGISFAWEWNEDAFLGPLNTLFATHRLRLPTNSIWISGTETSCVPEHFPSTAVSPRFPDVPNFASISPPDYPELILEGRGKISRGFEHENWLLTAIRSIFVTDKVLDVIADKSYHAGDGQSDINRVSPQDSHN